MSIVTGDLSALRDDEEWAPAPIQDAGPEILVLEPRRIVREEPRATAQPPKYRNNRPYLKRHNRRS